MRALNNLCAQIFRRRGLPASWESIARQASPTADFSDRGRWRGDIRPIWRL